MKKLVVLCGEDCAYCKKAKMLIRRALEKENKYEAIDIRYVLENSSEGKAYIHSLIPAFYCDGIRCFEGNPTMKDVVFALDSCL